MMTIQKAWHWDVPFFFSSSYDSSYDAGKRNLPFPGGDSNAYQRGREDRIALDNARTDLERRGESNHSPWDSNHDGGGGGGAALAIFALFIFLFPFAIIALASTTILFVAFKVFSPHPRAFKHIYIAAFLATVVLAGCAVASAALFWYNPGGVNSPLSATLRYLYPLLGWKGAYIAVILLLQLPGLLLSALVLRSRLNSRYGRPLTFGSTLAIALLVIAPSLLGALLLPLYYVWPDYAAVLDMQNLQ